MRKIRLHPKSIPTLWLPDGETIVEVDRDYPEGVITADWEDIPTIRVSPRSFALIFPRGDIVPPGEYRLVVDPNYPFGTYVLEDWESVDGPLGSYASTPGKSWGTTEDFAASRPTGPTDSY